MAPNWSEFRFESGLPANKHFTRAYDDQAINNFLEYVYSVTTQERLLLNWKKGILKMCRKEILFWICTIKITFLGILRTSDYGLIESCQCFEQMTQNSTKDAFQKV